MIDICRFNEVGVIKSAFDFGKPPKGCFEYCVKDVQYGCE
jgi:hypothetical protein